MAFGSQSSRPDKGRTRRLGSTPLAELFIPESGRKRWIILVQWYLESGALQNTSMHPSARPIAQSPVMVFPVVPFSIHPSSRPLTYNYEYVYYIVLVIPLQFPVSFTLLFLLVTRNHCFTRNIRHCSFFSLVYYATQPVRRPRKLHACLCIIQPLFLSFWFSYVRPWSVSVRSEPWKVYPGLDCDAWTSVSVNGRQCLDLTTPPPLPG